MPKGITPGGTRAVGAAAEVLQIQTRQACNLPGLSDFTVVNYSIQTGLWSRARLKCGSTRSLADDDFYMDVDVSV